MDPPLSRSSASAPEQAVGGSIDYRLARERAVMAYKSGEATLSEVCDAQSELMRNARECGRATDVSCPICLVHKTVEVTYIFGPRLPAGGRCMVTQADWDRVRRHNGEFTAYDVEVCPSCRWNHLLRTNPVLGVTAS